MVSKKIVDVQKEVDNILRELSNAKNDLTRYKVTLKLLKLPKKEIVKFLVKAFQKQPRLRWVFPSVLSKLAEKGIPGVKDALRYLLVDKDSVVRANAIRVIAEFGWTDDCIDELLKITDKETPPGPFLAALEALTKTTSNRAFDGLLNIASRNIKNPWRRGNVLEGLANHNRTEAKDVFEETLNNSKEHPYVKLMAAFGLARLGDRSALEVLRKGLDSADLSLSGSAANKIREILNTPEAYAQPQINRLRVWWDKHPAEIEKRFSNFKKKQK